MEGSGGEREGGESAEAHCSRLRISSSVWQQATARGEKWASEGSAD